MKPKGLLLRPTSTEDAEFIFELLNSPKWLQFIGDRKVKNIKDAKNYIRRGCCLNYSEWDSPIIRSLGNLIIQKIGACGLYDREGVDGSRSGL